MFIVLLCAMAAAGIVLRADGTGSREAIPTPPAPWGMADPTEEPATEPVQEAVSPTPELTPEPTPEPTQEPASTQSYLKTAIVINGHTRIVMSSREAAEELLLNVQRHFEGIADLPENALTELVSKVALEEASQSEEPMTYDAAFELLTAPSTPLMFRSTVTSVEDIVSRHSDHVIADSMLPKGIRVARLVGRDGIERKVWTSFYINGEFQRTVLEETYTVIERIDGDIRIGLREFPEDYVVRPGFGSDPELAHSIGFVPPVHGEVIKLYGPFDGGFHHGIDIAAPGSTPVAAAADGTVVSVMERGAYGLMVEIEHEFGFTTRYARLSEANVSVGDTVSAGDLIGSVGTEDHTTHLHFELRMKGTAYNPLKVLPLSAVQG